MKRKHLRSRLKQEIYNSLYNSKNIKIFIDYYGIYIDFLKLSVSENDSVESLIKKTQEKLNNYLIRKCKSQKFKLCFETFSREFVFQFKNNILKTNYFWKDNPLFFQKNLITETKILLIFLYKRLNFLHPNNKTFYEKIIRGKGKHDKKEEKK